MILCNFCSTSIRQKKVNIKLGYLRRKHNLVVLLLILLGLFVVIQFLSSNKLPEILKHYQELSRLLKNESFICKIPELDPWDTSILKYYEKVKRLKCTSLQSNVSYIEKGYLKINKDLVSGECLYRYVFHIDGDDFAPKYGNWATISESVKLESDIVEIKCQKSSLIPIANYNYHWSHVVPRNLSLKTSQPFAENDPEKPGLIIVGLDSMSLSNFIRQLPKTYTRLKQLDFQVMRHHVKIADNTYPNLLAFLTGKRGYSTAEFPAELNEQWDIAYDDFPFIWKEFQQQGFATLFSEDRPEMATFNYLGKLKGFLQEPTDHYLRPFYLSFYQNLLHRRSVMGCYDTQPMHKIMLDYLQSFLNGYSNRKKFAFMWSQDLSHNFLNLIGVADEDFEDFFARNARHLEDSIFVVISDHGHRFAEIRETTVGRYEVRLPFLAIRIPDKLKQKYPDLRKNLAENSQKMTTHFDVYATFRQTLESKFYDTQLPTQKQRGYSLFGKMPDKRSCYEASIPDDYCPCINEVSIPVLEALEPALSLLQHINLLALKNNDFSPPNTKCAVLELDTIMDTYVRVFPSKILVDPEDGNAAAKDAKLSYRIVLKAKAPSNAILEGVVSHDLHRNVWNVNGEIERNNRYGNTSYCVRNPVLKKTCYCIKS